MKRTRVSNCFKMPNVIIEDTNLTYSAKIVAATLYAHRNALNYCRLGLIRLARYSGCSIATVRDALERLADSGYISTYRNYAWSAQRGRMVFKKDAVICRISTNTGFTFIPRDALRNNLRKSSFTVYLLIRRLAGNQSRAFPSLRRVAETLAMGIATVCRAVKELAEKSLLHREHCVKHDGAHACNSYFMLNHTGATKAAPESVEEDDAYTFAAVVPMESVCFKIVHRSWKSKQSACKQQASFPIFSIIPDPPGCNIFSSPGVLSNLANYYET